MKKSLAVLFALAFAGTVLGQDDQASQETMENADMSDGTTHWHGDCQVAGADMSSDFITNHSSAKGIVVVLHSSSWTKITQDIHEYKSTGPQILTVVYQASPDLKFSTRREDYTNLGPIVGFGGAQVPSTMGQITALIDMPPDQRATARQDYNSNSTIYTIYPDKTTVVHFAPKLDQTPQTFTGPMNPPPATHDDTPTFVLAFPPGSGSITITKISLLPGRGMMSAPGMNPGNPYYHPQPGPPQ